MRCFVTCLYCFVNSVRISLQNGEMSPQNDRIKAVTVATTSSPACVVQLGGNTRSVRRVPEGITYSMPATEKLYRRNSWLSRGKHDCCLQL